MRALGGALALGGLAALLFITLPHTGGELVFPLDDAYIHLAVARTLAESGTWGVNPGEFASASSSPLWTAMLALLFRVFGASPIWALVGNVLAVVLLIVEARRWASSAPVVAMVLLMPLPFLAGLGMEHVLHAALALLLVRAVEERSTWVGVIAVAAVMTRYETVFLCVAIAAVHRRPGALLAAVAAVAVFGAWSAWQGGAWVPNGITRKANAGAWAGVVAAAKENAWVLLLGVAALFTGSSRGRVVALAIAMQAVFGRFGWFWRYEGWLIGMGVLVVGPWVTLRRAWVVTLAIPLGMRAWTATAAFPGGAAYAARADVAVGRWLAEDWAGIPVAVHDLGAAAFYGRSPIVDLAGLGTEEIAALHRAHALDAASMGRILDEHGVVLAIAGRHWLDGARPESIEPVASLFVEYPQEPGEFETVIWAVRGRVPVPREWPEGVRVRLAGDPEVDLETAVLEGAAVHHEEGGVTFYTNGRARMIAPASGTLRVVWHGTPAEGRGPRFSILVDGVPASSVTAGATIEIVYEDDLVDEDGNDRNLYVRRVVVE